MPTYASESSDCSGEVTAEIPPLASAWVVVWRTRLNSDSMHLNWGPEHTITTNLQCELSSLATCGHSPNPYATFIQDSKI